MPTQHPASAPGAPGGGAPPANGRSQVFLHAGQVMVATRPTAITTVLGSCVSVCLWDPTTGVGGMNHFLLPLHVERERSARFGTVAMSELVEGLVRAGARREALLAKVFGGASVVGAFRGRRSLGAENVGLALRLLEEARISVRDRDVGGEQGRKVIFHADEGSAWVRRL